MPLRKRFIPPGATAIRAECGLTLVELLVAVLIVGVLAAIAIPGFLSRRVKASDAVAKELVHAADQTAVNYGLTSGYVGMTPAALNSLERTINITANGQAVLVNALPTASGYFLTVVSSTADTFNLTSAGGLETRTCTISAGNGNIATNTGGGCKNGTW